MGKYHYANSEAYVHSDKTLSSLSGPMIPC